VTQCGRVGSNSFRFHITQEIAEGIGDWGMTGCKNLGCVTRGAFVVLAAITCNPIKKKKSSRDSPCGCNMVPWVGRSGKLPAFHCWLHPTHRKEMLKGE